jgi:predicted acylesterase/phospholipase RssA
MLNEQDASGGIARPRAMFIPPRRLMFAGGGAKVISHIGALDELEKRGYLRHVKEFMGTSAGAFIALCKVIGYTQKEMRDIMLKFDFQNLYNPDIDNIFEFNQCLGIDDGSQVRRFLEACMRVKGFSATSTFRELVTKTGIGFRCFASDLETMDIREFSVAKTPDECIVAAIYASSAIPFYFMPVRDTATGHMLVDGGIVNNTPLKYLTEVERIETLVIALRDPAVDSFKEESIAEYSLRLFACYYVQRYREINIIREQICYVTCGNSGVFDINMPHEKRLGLIDGARQDMADFIDNTLEFIRRPVRRASV